MTDARAAIHAMFQLDEAGTAELDLRLDAHRAEVLAEGAEAIDVKQDEYEAEERQRFGHLDHEAVLQREAVRDMAALLRQMADEGKATAPAAPVAPDVRAVVHAALRTVQGGLHHLGLVTLEVLTDRVTEAVAPLVPGAELPTAVVDFFQPGRTYAHGDYRFICEYLVTHPASGRRSAWGWFGKNGGWRHHSFSERQFQVREWTDVTEAGTR